MGRITASAASSVKGVRRASNQDRHLIDEELGVVLLADGVAGRPAGERAAELAIKAAFAQLGLALCRDSIDPTSAAFALAHAFFFANATLERAVQRDESLRNMATTLVGAVFVGGQVVIGSLGDSRAYRLRRAFLKQVTTDHVVHPDELEELAAEHVQAGLPLVQLLTPAVGNPLRPVPDVHVEVAATDDIFLFCSNGLSDALERQTIADVLLSSDSLQTACERLIRAAAGADDDATVVLARPAPLAGV